MNTTPTITALNHSLYFTGNIPSSLKDYHIPGSQALSTSGQFGDMMLQTLPLEDSFICIYIFDLNEKTTFIISHPDTFVLCRIVSIGRFVNELLHAEAMTMSENTLVCVYADFLNNRIHIEKGLHLWIDLFYVPERVLRALRFIPRLANFENNIINRVPSSAYPSPLKANAAIVNYIVTILQTPFSPHHLELHRQISSSLLHEILKLAGTSYVNILAFYPHDIERIKAARDYIDRNSPRHFSIPDIAGKVGINQQKLKTGFKQIFGKGLYTYLREQVLEIARLELEETNKSIKEIAYRAGYSNPNNFSAAFKRHFGLKPLQWRSKSRDQSSLHDDYSK